MDCRHGSLRHRGCPSEEANNFFLSWSTESHSWGRGDAERGLERMHGLVVALLPDDRLTSYSPVDQEGLYICCLPGSSRSHRSDRSIKFPCITAAMLLPCDTDQQLLPWVSLRLAHTQPISWLSKDPIGNTLPLTSPHCDAASQTPTLPIKETTETPPPQAVKLHICGPHLPAIPS